jgi:hypothetical protein
MAARDMWKLLHLLHIYGPSLSRAEVRKAGITCDPDTIHPLASCGAIEVIPANSPYEKAKEYRISKSALGIIQNCLVTNRGNIWGVDLRVDEPEVFVIMPFSKDWSKPVYTKMIKPVITGAGLKCIRGDSIVRTGDLTANILKALFTVGVIVADISEPNANVYYEVGLCHAIGKDVILLKQAATILPADFGGAHYYEYKIDNLEAGKKLLAKALKKWSANNCVAAVKALGK